MLLTPYAVPYVFPHKLVMIPLFIIFTAATFLWLTRSPSSRRIAGGLLVLLGLTEAFLTMPMASIAMLFLGLITLGIGIALASSGATLEGKALVLNPKIPVTLIMIGTLAMLAAILTVSFLAVVVALGAFISGIALGAAYVALRIKDTSLKTMLALALIVFGILEIVSVEPKVHVWGFIFGSAIVLAGIGFGAAVFKGWLTAHVISKNKPLLKKLLTASLVLVICGSAIVASARMANLVHEVPESRFTSVTASNLSVRGTVADIKVNYLVDLGYTYHVFPAYITLRISQVTFASDPWENNLTAANQYYQGKNIIVDYEKAHLPKLTVDQQLEVTGYAQTYWMEDSMFNGMLIISETISGSNVRPL